MVTKHSKDVDSFLCSAANYMILEKSFTLYISVSCDKTYFFSKAKKIKRDALNHSP